MKRGSEILETLNDDQCERIYASLHIDRKRKLLENLDEYVLNLGGYMDLDLFRDIISIIVQYIDVKTWGRMKQVCKTFNARLGDSPPILLHIQSNIGNVDIFERKYLFFTFYRRFLFKLNFKTHNKYFRSDSHAYPVYKQELLSGRTNRTSMPVTKSIRIKYPSGYIIMNGSVRGTIFDKHFMGLFNVNGTLPAIKKRSNEYSDKVREMWERVKRENKT